MRIKKLKENYKRDGFGYKNNALQMKLVAEDGFIRMYEVRTYLDRVLGYEVGKTRYQPPNPRNLEDVKDYDLVERAFGGEDFGKTAWYYNLRKDADVKFKNLRKEAYEQI